LKQSSCWGELNIVTIPFGEGGDQGKTLNVGSKHATAFILTFLHADTMIPFGWDEQIEQALVLSKEEKDATKDNVNDNSA